MSKLNANYTSNGVSSNGQSMAIVRVDSKPSQRKDGVITRKTAVFQQATKTYSVPAYGFVLRVDSNPDGVPSGQRGSASAEFRVPVGLNESDLDEMITDFRAFVNDEDLKDSILRQVFPCQACPTEESEG